MFLGQFLRNCRSTNDWCIVFFITFSFEAKSFFFHCIWQVLPKVWNPISYLQSLQVYHYYELVLVKHQHYHLIYVIFPLYHWNQHPTYLDQNQPYYLMCTMLRKMQKQSLTWWIVFFGTKEMIRQHKRKYYKTINKHNIHCKLKPMMTTVKMTVLMMTVMLNSDDDDRVDDLYTNVVR